MAPWAPFALSAAAGILAGLPLTPALTELRRRMDALPLATRTDDGDVRNFADSLRKYLEPLTRLASDPAVWGHFQFKVLRDGAAAVVVTSSEIERFVNVPLTAVVYAPEDLSFHSAVCFLRDLYVRGNLSGANDSVLRAVLCDGNATLGERTSVMRWIHAEGNIEAGQESRLFGRASASGSITLAYGCQFERLHAIMVSTTLGQVFWAEHTSIFGEQSIIDSKLGRLCIHRDFHLNEGDIVQGHVVASGKVTIAGNVRVTGSLKSHTGIQIASGAELDGAVISRGNLAIGSRCYIRGPVLGEEELVIGAGTQIGSPGMPTTVSAPRIRLSPGALVFGTVWAREKGEVAE
jgi:hypothetical protein